MEWRKLQGNWTGTFTVKGIDEGRHRIRFEVHPAFPVSGPVEITVPTEENLVFEIRDDVPVANVRFVPHDADTKEVLPSFDVDLELPGDVWDGEEFWLPDTPVLRDHPREVPFDWFLRAVGYAPSWGTYEPDPEAEGDVALRIPMTRGWGIELHVWDPDREPLEGVLVSIDGIPVGRTDSDGELHVTAPERPLALGFEFRDWVLSNQPSWRNDLAPDGRLLDREVFVDATLCPPDR